MAALAASENHRARAVNWTTGLNDDDDDECDCDDDKRTSPNARFTLRGVCILHHITTIRVAVWLQLECLWPAVHFLCAVHVHNVQVTFSVTMLGVKCGRLFGSKLRVLWMTIASGETVNQTSVL